MLLNEMAGTLLLGFGGLTAGLTFLGLPPQVSMVVAGTVMLGVILLLV